MGPPLFPVVANIFIEHLKSLALDIYNLKPKLWVCYVDDIFMVWLHGRNHLNHFIQHLNTQHHTIKFTMEMEEDQQLPFLDVLVKMLEDGNISHTVYRKATQTNKWEFASPSCPFTFLVPHPRYTIIKTFRRLTQVLQYAISKKCPGPKCIGGKDHLDCVQGQTGKATLTYKRACSTRLIVEVRP